MSPDSIEVRQEEPLLELLGHFGGWPVLEGNSWKADNFSWINLVTSLRHFNNDILVMIWVGPDGKDSNDFIVQFDQSDLLLPAIDYYGLGFEHPILQSYYNLLINTATLLGADRATANKDMKDLILFETELAMVR